MADEKGKVPEAGKPDEEKSVFEDYIIQLRTIKRHIEGALNAAENYAKKGIEITQEIKKRLKQ